MTDAHPNAQLPNMPHSQAPARRNRSLTTSKLRYSCHACALSKVKCPKEKPSCSRCLSRGITCEYFVTKRPGRKRDNSQSQYMSNNNGPYDTNDLLRQSALSGQGPWLSSNTNTTLVGTNNYMSPSNLIATTPQPGNVSAAECSSATSDVFSGLWMPPEPCLSPTLAGLNNEFNDFFTSPTDVLELETLEYNSHNYNQGRNDISKLLIPDDINHELISEISSSDRPNASKASSPSPNGQALLTQSDTSVSLASDSAGCCLMQALDLLKNLSSTAATKPSTCHLSNSPADFVKLSLVNPNGSSNSRHQSVQTVVQENREINQAVSNMLQCSCAEDGYLLTTLSMILFKILGRYAVAARMEPQPREPKALENRDGNKSNGSSRRASSTLEQQMIQLGSSGSSSTSTSCYGPDDQDLGRKDTQLILSELHRVQRLVNELSPIFKAHGLGATKRGGYCQITLGWNGERAATTFSGTILDQIEVDLRRCLSALSSEIINTLRHN
ncbi:aflatoxin regulatory protein-domain-containing protein [Pseudomassariella vexata]|uniref:Aflatoxin regulatory protein-domain-containing protein n=1 Tax=Pseudomassariella vexata TaxID=1141098 RepID=A0A1Y2EDK8_9PEZI|nr:aflatoxin regulatory protein-domain-containing protein [Pseudomassariella vexata]ORY69640.1 aflatoxin regulatory protein-domain-containing protein [Pseudomassariella vexata]